MSHLTVTLPEGTVQGGWTRQFPQVRAFLGLPFAAPPVGSLRFAPPAPCPRSDSWSSLGAAVPAALGAAFAEATQLTADVWTPAGAIGSPVLVWLDDEPGAATSARRFCAGLAAEHGIVVVMPRRRRGALGYLDLTALRDGFGNGNFGLLDQMEALTWVATHARAFGGDPTAITVSGRGEGAHAAALLAGLPRTSPLVRRLVLPVGVPEGPVQTPGEAARAAAAFLALLDTDPDGRRGLREVEATVIVRTETELRHAEGRPSFGLVAHDDLPFGDLAELLRAAESPVEVMIGGAGADPAGWTVWRCGEDRAAERVSTVGSCARRGLSDGYGSGFGAFVRTGDPASATAVRAEPPVHATAGRERLNVGAAR